jgi:hypothetical protein
MSNQPALVTHCQVENCSYNRYGNCKTIGINVSGPEPLCDTYIVTRSKAGVVNKKAYVGACKVANCLNNEALECMLKGITVVFRDNQAMCGAFSSKP